MSVSKLIDGVKQRRQDDAVVLDCRERQTSEVEVSWVLNPCDAKTFLKSDLEF